MIDIPKSHRDLLDAQFASLATIGGYLEVRGNARLEPDDDYAFAGRVGTKYDADLKVHNRPGDSRVVVTIEAINVYAVDMGGG